MDQQQREYSATDEAIEEHRRRMAEPRPTEWQSLKTWAGILLGIAAPIIGIGLLVYTITHW